jgi:hypothetical protein
MKRIEAIASMTESELDEHVEKWHPCVMFSTVQEHAEDHRVHKQSHRHDRRPHAEVAPKLKVQPSEGMDGDRLYKHVRARHPELAHEDHVAELRKLHADSHALIPAVLSHVHEAPSQEARLQA